ATVGNFQPLPKIYPIKSEKSQEAFYIVDKESNYMDSLAQDPNYYKYLEQAKAQLKKPQQQNQNARMDRIESKVDEIGQIASQFRRIILDNQSKKPCVPDVDKNLFSMEIHRKSYIIPTFKKPAEIDRPSTSFHAIVVQNNNTEKQTTSSSFTKTNTKKRPIFNESSEKQKKM
ncbi:9179_t:CDS:2, partial [Gigaspora margarita]